jgi:SAM-dependent methyltransferase
MSTDHRSYDPEFFSQLFKVEDKHFWFRARNQLISAIVAQLIIDLPPGYRVLEVGCGTGNVLRHLKQVCANGTVIGMDLFFEGLSFAKRRIAANLVQGDIHHPPFSEHFNLIGLFDVLEHLDDDVEMLSLLRQRLTPDGALLLTVPAHMSLWSYFDDAGKHARRYTIPELSSKLKQTGYQVDYITEYMATIFPIVWLGRKLTTLAEQVRGNNGSKDPKAENRAQELSSRELKVTPIFNAIIYAILSQEMRFVANRHRLPIGTSILAIARPVR